METILVIAAIVQGVAISLGVGTSTIAIVNFFAAIADGVIDQTERHMMGYVYFVLRIAMVLILITILITFTSEFVSTGTLYLGTATAATLILVALLYANAILMTCRIMPSTVGPALQAATWYTLGAMASFASLGLITFSLLTFMLGYASVVLLAVAIVNGIMAYLKSKHNPHNPVR